MSTCLHDLHSAAELQVSIYPSSVTATGAGSEVDFTSADGPCFAIQMVGGIVDGTTLDGYLEESADGTTWAAIPGAVFEQVAEANSVQVITFQRTQRYVHWKGTIAGTSPSFTVAVVVGEQKKTL